ncbi:MAG: bifunctional metallophosphatase/5'-nucleotidase [Ignavibacteriaceae bacterium]
MYRIFKRLQKITLILFLLSSSLLFAQNVNLKFIETSDVHGAILPYDLVNDTTMNSSLAQVYTYVEKERQKKDQDVILLDAGDILQGDPLVYYYNYEDTSSKHIYAEAMNYMKYDVATVGNHDIETGHNVYDKFRTELNFPWLAANAINTETGKPYFQPYFITEKDGIKIAILGMITPAIPNWLPEKIWKGIEFEDMIQTAKKWVKIIYEKEKPDLLIGLFHSGVDYTYGGQTKDSYRNENASRLVAEQVPGFDIVFVGHDHVGWNFKTVNVKGDSVLIVGPKARARTISVANVSMNYNSNLHKWEKEYIAGETIQTSDYEPDAGFMKNFKSQLDIVSRYVSKPLGIIDKTLSAKESLFGPSLFVDLIQKFQLATTDADVSLASPLSFSAEIDSGEIYVGDMFKLYRYENFLYTISLTGKEIKDYLEFSFGNWFNQMSSSNDHLLNFKKDENGNLIYSGKNHSPRLAQVYYNFSSAAGINYTVDVTKPAGERVNVTSSSDGTPFDLVKAYKVAINSYRGNGGGGHLTRGANIDKSELAKRIITSTDKDLRYYMMKWIEKKKVITPKIIGNWKIIPEDWWKKGKEKDYKLLFGNSAE